MCENIMASEMSKENTKHTYQPYIVSISADLDFFIWQSVLYQTAMACSKSIPVMREVKRKKAVFWHCHPILLFYPYLSVCPWILIIFYLPLHHPILLWANPIRPECHFFVFSSLSHIDVTGGSEHCKWCSRTQQMKRNTVVFYTLCRDEAER